MPEMARLKLAIDHAQAMHKTLTLPKNMQKGHWSGIEINDLVDHLQREVEEFHAALWAFIFHGGSIEAVESEGSDISSFVAMIVDNLRNGRS